MKLIDGKQLALKFREEIKSKVDSMKTKPGLAVVRVGEDPASVVYVNSKHKACEKAGIYSEIHVLDEKIAENTLVKTIKKLNKDKTINGILVQLPLPAHINEVTILSTVDPSKDVDGFHPLNMGKLFAGNSSLVPATPKGIIKLIESVTTIAGKTAVIVGRSNIVGKPVAMLLLQNNATVTICHSKTQDLIQECKRADILVAAVGSAKFISKDMIKPGAVVIDVGINRVGSDNDKGYKLVGDVDFENVQEIAGHITPVPGGVGPMTIAMLLDNCLLAKEMQER
jgi:methylenetetrahydrofolate dehydrogenase (NADP+) / methenyltetrahydrofolate cyclohydrolase